MEEKILEGLMANCEVKEKKKKKKTGEKLETYHWKKLSP
jgi:predicted ribosome quality control (RQC) complex YloA/Tae2 family protein